MVYNMKYGDASMSGTALARFELYGYKAVVKSCGSHMCGYVLLPNDHPLVKDIKLALEDSDDEYDITTEIDPYVWRHGGVTFVTDNLSYDDHDDTSGWWIGWDYAHYGDYCDCGQGGPRDYETVWTVEQIIAECGYVIRQIEEIYNGEMEERE